MQVLPTKSHKGLLQLRLERDRDEIERIRRRYGDHLAEVAAYRSRCYLLWDLVQASAGECETDSYFELPIQKESD